MQTTRPICLGLLGVMVIMLAGCATGPSRLEADFGTSYDRARFHQILTPEAEENLEPVYGFDGIAAHATMEKYATTFEKPPPPPTYAISVGQIK